MPDENGIKVRPAADSVILTGTVSSAVKAKYAEDIANAFVRDVNKSLVLPIAAGDAKVEAGTKLQVSQGQGQGGAATGAKVVNLLQIAEAQQVMLEVTIAEVSKTLLDKLGASFDLTRRNGNWLFNLSSNLLSGGAGLLSAIKGGHGTSLILDAEKNDGLVKILAEPNIVAISGQEASFLAGGKIFIPVARSNAVTGISTITLEEKEFGVGLKFTPTVLEGGRIHLKVAPEVSELSQTGSPFTTLGGETAVLPSFTTRRVQTSVQLMDGQSLAIAGLIKNNVKQAADKVPGLGEVPVMGALFRSSEFQADRSELMFVITPRLIKPLDQNYMLPTDSFTPPSRSEFYFGNKQEGAGHEDVPADKRNAPAMPAPSRPVPAATGGMEVK
ncbi:type II and III secretion system protein family protein [Polaromonas sp. P1-6]|nr:type II and III secretion system protein family protein [Polaromonas sp. P1-6]